MRINELLTESQQHEQLDEGPFGTAVGKLAGGVAKGVGAVAGGVAGMGKAFKKGYQSGKATVAGDPDPNTEPEAQAAAPKPAPGGADDEVGGPTAQPAAGDINKAGPAGTAAAKPLQGAAKIAADKTAAATAGQDQVAAGQTMYATVKANIDKLDKKGKQRILQLLQKSMAAPAPGGAAGKPAASSPGAAAAAMTGGPTAGLPPAPGEEPADAGAGAMGSMANQLGSKPANTMANAPVSTTNKAKPGNPNAAPAAEPQAAPAPGAAPAVEPAAPVKQRTGGRVKGQLSQNPRAVKRREANAAKTKQQPQGQSQAELDADRERMMGNFTDSVERHKQRMVAEAFSRGEISLFRQR